MFNNNFVAQTTGTNFSQSTINDAIMYVLYKITDNGRINIGYYKNGEEVVAQLNTIYNTQFDHVNWFEVDKVNFQSKMIETFVMTTHGYVSKNDNKLYNFNTVPPQNYINLVAKIECRRLIKEINLLSTKMEKKINMSYMNVSPKINELLELYNKLLQIEKEI